MFKFNGLCAILALSAAPAVVAEELSETGEFVDGVAAIVNEGVVLKSKYNETLAMIREQAQKNGFQLPPPDILKEQVLERVVLEEIQLQQAERIGLQISDEMLNQTATMWHRTWVARWPNCLRCWRRTASTTRISAVRCART